MTAPDKHMVTALTISTILVIFNIVAVAEGSAAIYYTHMENLISNLMPIF